MDSVELEVESGAPTTTREIGTKLDLARAYLDRAAAGGVRRQKLVDYCCDDVELLPDLEKARPYLDLHQAVCETCAVFPDSWALKPTAFVDGFMFKKGLDTLLNKAAMPANQVGRSVKNSFNDTLDLHINTLSRLFTVVVGNGNT